jgi:hypothetical protein
MPHRKRRLQLKSLIVYGIRIAETRLGKLNERDILDIIQLCSNFTCNYYNERFKNEYRAPSDGGTLTKGMSVLWRTFDLIISGFW